MIHLVANFASDLSQPNRSRILGSPKRIEQIFLVLSGVNRRRKDSQRERSCQRLRQTLGNKCDDVGLSYNLKGLQIAGNSKRNVSCKPFLPEPAIDRVFQQPPATTATCFELRNVLRHFKSDAD